MNVLTVLVTRTAKGNRVPKLLVGRSQTFLMFQTEFSIQKGRLLRNRILRSLLLQSFLSFEIPFVYFSGFCFVDFH